MSMCFPIIHRKKPTSKKRKTEFFGKIDNGCIFHPPGGVENGGGRWYNGEKHSRENGYG